MQAALFAAAKGVRIMVFRLPPYVWGNGGSFFIPLHIQAARERGKAYYILPGESTILCPKFDVQYTVHDIQ
jgi:hypothetical protein